MSSTGSGRTSDGSNIGGADRKVALLLAERATVLSATRKQTLLDQAASALEAPVGRLHAFAADVTDAGSIARLRDQVQSVGGHRHPGAVLPVLRSQDAQRQFGHAPG